ncbi:MAG: hypothetical protein S4CHLAM37_03100 [Chlamydiia bacterium]|nr:hypothetical protein [Chlamydiia bacterium]
MSEATIIILLFLKGLFSGFIYNFVAFTSALFISDFIIKQGRPSGLIASFGISLTHMFWAAITAFALSFTFLRLHENIYIYTFIGSFILLYFAYRIYTKKKKSRFAIYTKPIKQSKIFLESVLFCLGSPGKVIGYAGLFAAVNVPKTDPAIMHKIPLILGVGIGSFGWWLIYIYLINQKTTRISPKRARLFQKIAAFTLVFVGFAGIINSLIGWR